MGLSSATGAAVSPIEGIKYPCGHSRRNDVIRQPCIAVPNEMFGTKKLEDMVQHLIRAKRSVPCVGLAAPQLGYNYRLYVVEIREEELEKKGISKETAKDVGSEAFPMKVFVNPKLKVTNRQTVNEFEGCLSVPHYAAQVKRFRSVSVMAQNYEDGSTFTLSAHKWLARILQHEQDHLDGRLFVDTMDTRSLTYTGTETH
eukprot:Nk52_evm22s2011 gene=Nk52_evmTU22s2011